LGLLGLSGMEAGLNELEALGLALGLQRFSELRLDHLGAQIPELGHRVLVVAGHGPVVTVDQRRGAETLFDLGNLLPKFGSGGQKRAPFAQRRLQLALELVIGRIVHLRASATRAGRAAEALELAPNLDEIRMPFGVERGQGGILGFQRPHTIEVPGRVCLCEIGLDAADALVQRALVLLVAAQLVLSALHQRHVEILHLGEAEPVSLLEGRQPRLHLGDLLGKSLCFLGQEAGGFLCRLLALPGVFAQKQRGEFTDDLLRLRR
jgi:hypothetical protein